MGWLIVVGLFVPGLLIISAGLSLLSRKKSRKKR